MQFALPPLTPVTKRLLIVNTAIFLACWLLYLVHGETKYAVYRVLSLNPELWSSWFPLVPVWQVFTHGFLHSTENPTHLLWNMIQLYFFGTMLEAAVGSRRFLTTYLAAMLCGAAMQMFVMMASQTQVSAVGASGAVVGVVVAMATLRPRAQVFVFFIPVTLMLLAIVIVALDFIFAMNTLVKGAGTGVAHWVHLGGAAFGFATVRFGWINVDWLERRRARRVVAGEQSRREDDLKMDALLEKIHREGMSSLTRAERSFLKRVSNRR